MYPEVQEYLEELNESIPRHIRGQFPDCQRCGQPVTEPCAGRDPFGCVWLYGHPHCLPEDFQICLRREDFEELAGILDWMVHLCQGRKWRDDFRRIVALVRPDWADAAREIERSYFASNRVP